MAATSTAKVSLKLLIDTEDSRVLFAEAGKEFVDFLFNLLSLPVGTVVRIVSKKDMAGSLGDLYESIDSLSESYLQTSEAKDALLKPKVCESGATLPMLLPNIDQTSNSSCFYRCGRSYNSNCPSYVTNDPTVTCPNCGNRMDRKVTFVDQPKKKTSTFEGGYVKGVVTYMIMDNLEVRPMSIISGIAVLNQLNVRDLRAFQEKVVDVGMDQGVELLKMSLLSKAVLTEVFLGKKPLSYGDKSIFPWTN